MPSQPKKMLIVAVLEILRKYTDEQHKLLQAPLLELLEKDYGLKVDRKSLRHNIEHLINAGYPLRYQRGWYYQHEFTRDELNDLACSIAGNLQLTAERICALVRKLNALNPICQPAIPDRPEALKVLLVEQALSDGCRLSFQADGKQMTGMIPLAITRETGLTLGSETGSTQPESWSLTVRTPDTQQELTYSLRVVTDIEPCG